MDAGKILDAAREIERLTLALRWLEEYRVSGFEGVDAASIWVQLEFGRGANGAHEATQVLRSKAPAYLPDLVTASITDCRNTIEIHRATIAAEAAQRATE